MCFLVFKVESIVIPIHGVSMRVKQVNMLKWLEKQVVCKHFYYKPEIKQLEGSRPQFSDSKACGSFTISYCYPDISHWITEFKKGNC